MGTIIGLASAILISSFVPFVTETYGEVCVWCWIFIIDKNCQVVIAGLLEQIFLWILYQAFISILCIFMILTSVILFLKAVYRMRKYHDLNFGHDYKHLFFKYIFQLILIPIFVDYADVVFKPHIHHYSFTLWVYYAIAPPISGFLMPFSFLLYIKFGNPGSMNNPQHVSNPQGCLRNRCDIRSTIDEQCSPFIDDFSSSDDYVTAHEKHGQTCVQGASTNSTKQAEGQSLLEGGLNIQYSS